MRVAVHARLLMRWLLSFPVALMACATTALAQQTDNAPAAAGGDSDPEVETAIVVTGVRGSAVIDLAPLVTLSTNAIAATGATTMSELLQSIRGTTQTADGAEPIFLLNAQRVSGYPEIGSLPPEAIERVEVLPEQTALRYGYPPTRRVVNFITKARFRQIELRAGAGTATRGGSTTGTAKIGTTRLQGGSRLTLGLEARRTDPLFQSDREIVPDPDIPFDALGNVTGIGGGEIDPDLSALSGQPVTIAPVPQPGAAAGTLADFAAAANRPRLFDLGPYRTLAAGNEGFKAEAAVADSIGETLSGSLTLSAEQSRERSFFGPAPARLIVPADNPFSPFSGPTTVNRYLIEAGLLRTRVTTTTLLAGATLSGAIGGWRWDVTGTYNLQQVAGRNERGIDATRANAAIAVSANPFAQLDAGLLTDRLVDETRLRRQTAGMKAVATNTPLWLPAGPLTVTATVEVERATAAARLRGPISSDLRLGRTRTEAGLSLDIPLLSRRSDGLSFIGNLSVNASVNLREVGGFGSLHDTTFGAVWTPVEGVQFLATIRRSAAAPDQAQQSTPIVQIADVPVFDYELGRTEVVVLIQGGNPDLLAERRQTRSLAINIKPFAARELRLSATYERTAIRDQTATVFAITPQAEAILPELFTRDPAGRLVAVTFRPINLFRERRRTLNLTLNANGFVGKAPPAAPGQQPPSRPGYYGGIGPTINLGDRLQLRPGTPELDLLAGDTIRGWGMSRTQGYVYGSIYHEGHGLKFSGWYQGGNRVRNADPAGDLRFSPIFKLEVGAYAHLGGLLPGERWARNLRLSLDIANITDARQRVRNGNGTVPNRFQADYLDPIGRTATLTLRKLL